jgi:type II secretory pathway component PulJ
MRRGYLLVEMIVVIFILALVGVIFDRFFVTFVFELPRNSRLIQESRILNGVIKCIRNDVTYAKTLSVTDDNDLLLTETPEGLILYKFNDGQISRVAPDADSANTIWKVPHGRIVWRVWNKDNTGYAVEVNAYIEDESLGHIRKKMDNSFLFFTGTDLGGMK